MPNTSLTILFEQAKSINYENTEPINGLESY